MKPLLKPLRLALTLIAGTVALVLAVPDADAGQRTRSGSYATGGGKTGTYSQRVDRAPGSVSRQGSITTQDGRTFSRSTTGNYDKSTGAVNRSVTNARGDTRTATGTYDRDTRTYDRTITGPKGGTTQATTVYDRDAKSASSTYVGPVGRTTTSTTTYNAANKGFDTTVTGAEGKTFTRSTANAYDRDAGTLTHSVTGPGGKTRTVDLMPDRPQ